MKNACLYVTKMENVFLMGSSKEIYLLDGILLKKKNLYL